LDQIEVNDSMIGPERFPRWAEIGVIEAVMSIGRCHRSDHVDWPVSSKRSCRLAGAIEVVKSIRWCHQNVQFDCCPAATKHQKQGDWP